MIVLVVLVALVAGVAISAGVPWPLAVVAGIAAPLIGSTLYLRLTQQDAPTRRLSPNDTRTRRFLAMLIERYRAQDYEHGAATLEDVLHNYDAGRVDRASELFASLSSSVAHSPYATMLISIWQATWRDAAKESTHLAQPQSAASRTIASEPSGRSALAQLSMPVTSHSNHISAGPKRPESSSAPAARTTSRTRTVNSEADDEKLSTDRAVVSVMPRPPRPRRGSRSNQAAGGVNSSNATRTSTPPLKDA